MSNCRLCGAFVNECGCGEDCEPFNPVLDASLNITIALQSSTSKSLKNLELSNYNVGQSLRRFKSRIEVVNQALANTIKSEIIDAANNILASEAWLPVENPHFVTRPWNLNASALKSEQSLGEIFNFECKSFPQTNLASVFIDRLLGHHFASPPALVNGLNLDVNAVNDEDRIIPIYVKPDGIWTDVTTNTTYVLEVKTVKSNILIEKHIEDYLRQVAAYQLLRYDDPDNTPEYSYLLVYIILENPEKPKLLVLEVVFNNLVVCAQEWKKWFKNLTSQAFKVDRLISQYRSPLSIKLIQDGLTSMEREEADMQAAIALVAKLEAEEKAAVKAAKKNKKVEPTSNNVFNILG